MHSLKRIALCLTLCLPLVACQGFQGIEPSNPEKKRDFANKDSLAPWNDPTQKDDPYAPWNDPYRKDDPSEPWNDPYHVRKIENKNPYIKDDDDDDYEYGKNYVPMLPPSY